MDAGGLANWCGNHRFAAARRHRPESIDAVRRQVAAARHVHAVGAHHSFNGSADSPGEIIDLRAIPADPVLDTQARTVTVGAGTTYAALAAWLEAQGWALHNMASLPHITVGGAVATGTHGSGDRLGTLSSAVAAIELVTATGDLARFRRGDDGFEGMVVALGALGVVTRVTLDIEPSYRLRQDAFADLPWQVLAETPDAVMGAGTSVSLFTCWSSPSIARLWIKTRLGVDSPPAPPGGALPTDQPGPVLPQAADAPLRRTLFGVAAPWAEVLCHIRPTYPPSPVEQIQSEVLVPRAGLAQAVAALRAIGTRIDTHLSVTEIRSMAADSLWLSPAQGRDTIGLHFTWKPHADAVAALTAEIESLLLPLGGRPHWGKLMHATAPALEALYPRLAAFRTLVGRMDPEGKFRNAFLVRHVLR